MASVLALHKSRVEQLKYHTDILCVPIFLGHIYLSVPAVHPPPLHRNLLNTAVPLICLWQCLCSRSFLYRKHNHEFDALSANQLPMEQNDFRIVR